jgi:hypothetical protein
VLAVLLAALLAAPPPAGAAEGVLYAGPEADPAFGELAPELLTALFPEHRLALEAAPDAAAALDHVAEEPGAVAIADLATMLGYAAAHALPPDRLVFVSPLARHCLLAFARRGGWVRGFGDIADAAGTPRPAIGLAGPDAAATLAELRRLDPGLEGLEVQPGLPAELAGRVAHGSLDLMLVVAHAGLDDAAVAQLDEDDRLTELPVVTRLLARAAAGPESGFTLAAYRPDSGLIPWSRPPMTLCTPIGVVLRDDAPPGLRAAIGRAGAAVAASLQRGDLASRAARAAKSALHDVVGAVRGWLGEP